MYSMSPQTCRCELNQPCMCIQSHPVACTELSFARTGHHAPAGSSTGYPTPALTRQTSMWQMRETMTVRATAYQLRGVYEAAEGCIAVTAPVRWQTLALHRPACVCHHGQLVHQHHCNRNLRRERRRSNMMVQRFRATRTVRELPLRKLCGALHLLWDNYSPTSVVPLS